MLKLIQNFGFMTTSLIYFIFCYENNIFIHNDIMCVGGCGCSETANHFFLACDIFASTWYFCGVGLVLISFLQAWLGNILICYSV